MKPFLVDVPVRINIWIRPECQKKQWEIIKKARPSILFIQSDGGRNRKEWKSILDNRKLIDNGIDWECTVYRLYENENNGLYAMGKKISELIWSKVDRCVFLEDDQIPSVSFFQFCAELLEKYKDDQRIECICGMNHLGVYKSVNSDYFFSRQGSIWGTATWRRVIAERTKNGFNYAKDNYTMELLKKRTKYNKKCWDRLVGYSENDYFEGHVAGSEFWIEFNMYAQNRLQIIPKYNLISNIGCTENSEHADAINQLPRGIRRVFNMNTYELSFPLKHSQYVIPDIGYEKKRNRIMGYNTPLVTLYRKVERFFLIIRYKGIKSLFKKLKSKIKLDKKSKLEN